MKHVREMNRMHRVERVGLQAYGEQDKYNLCAKGTKKNLGNAKPLKYMPEIGRDSEREGTVEHIYSTRSSIFTRSSM